MDIYEARISKVLFDSLGGTKATELLIDKVERQLDSSIRRTDYMPTMYEEPITIRLVYAKREVRIL